ncbi:hypothetical protein CRG98_023359, partial [Punica granatum]
MGAGEVEDVQRDEQLFETKSEGRGRLAYRVFAATVFLSICGVWAYRLAHILSLLFPDYLSDPGSGSGYKTGVIGETVVKKGTTYYYYLLWSSVGMFLAELVFGLYWVLSQSIRWNIVHRLAFKDKLSLRYEEKLPRIDIFVCTADPEMEPPSLVINTVLSVMSYNYPPEKLSVYLSDDGGSKFTFYALLEASEFAKHWIPFCNKFNIEPRSPDAYFAQQRRANVQPTAYGQECLAIKKLYKDMKKRIDEAVKIGTIPKDMKEKHKGFSEWNPNVTKWDHQSIVQ